MPVSKLLTFERVSLINAKYGICSGFSRPHLGSVPDFRYPLAPSAIADNQTDSYSTSVLRRPQKGRLAALRDEPSKV